MQNMPNMQNMQNIQKLSKLEEISDTHLNLSDEEISIIREIYSAMDYIADLLESDIFIDCFCDDGNKAIVVAAAKPHFGISLYDRWVVGEYADMENEPAIFAVRATGFPARDLRATTQEKRSVRQDVIPIKNKACKVFAVLIREKDVSEDLRLDRKHSEMIRMLERLKLQTKEQEAREQIVSQDTLAKKEIHHRIKNNLQMVASILNMQARRSSTTEIKNIFKENVSRVMSFAAIHEILTQNGLEDILSIGEVIESVRRNTMIYCNHEERHIDIQMEGEDFLISVDKATSIALVVNELLTNAVEHAFVDRKDGKITITLSHGGQYSAITVADNGIGFDSRKNDKNSLGLAIVDMTVKESLHGKTQILSDEEGSRIRFDFKN